VRPHARKHGKISKILPLAQNSVYNDAMIDEQKEKQERDRVKAALVTAQEEYGPLYARHDDHPRDLTHDSALPSSNPRVEEDRVIANFDAACVRMRIPTQLRTLLIQRYDLDISELNFLAYLFYSGKAADRVRGMKLLNLKPLPEDEELARQENLSEEALLASATLTVAGFRSSPSADFTHRQPGDNLNSLTVKNADDTPPPPKGDTPEEEEENDDILSKALISTLIK